MRKILIYLAILALFYCSANAGLFGDDVDLADLSQLSPDALETLKDTEFNVFLTKVKHAGAKVSENKAGENLKTARLTMDSKNLRLKSAEADLKEARAIQDQGQIEAAADALRIAKEDYERAKMLIKWKEKEVDVQVASVKKAKLDIEMAEAERDVARVSKLIEQNVASAQKYNLSDFKAKVDKKNKEYQKALSSEAKEIAEAKKLNAEYEKMSKR
jgi:hypothetical protein